jgi:hypothetical protein
LVPLIAFFNDSNFFYLGNVNFSFKFIIIAALLIDDVVVVVADVAVNVVNVVNNDDHGKAFLSKNTW